MRHKHADIIHAWAEGADIEMRSEFTYPRWIPVTLPSPQFAEEREYRIKPPKRKPDEVGYVGVAFADDGCWYLTEAYEERCNVPERTDDAKVSAILKLTQCGETGKLLKAEVL